MAERIQKLISEAGLMSRRAAEQAITEGRVQVNGVTAELGCRADPETDEMEYLDGEVDETEQLNFVLAAMKEEQRPISAVQIQLIQDAELQYGIEHGYYSEE